MIKKNRQRLAAALLVLAMFLPGPVTAAGLTGGFVGLESAPTAVGVLGEEQSLGEPPDAEQAQDDAAGGTSTEGAETGDATGESAIDPNSTDESNPEAPAGGQPESAALGEELLASHLPDSPLAMQSASSTTIVSSTDDYWHVDQVMSTQSQSAGGAWLGEEWKQVEAQLVLQDAASNTVGMSDVKRTGGSFGELYTSWFAPPGLEPGEYHLRAVSALGAVHPTWSRTLQVTDSILVVRCDSTSPTGGNFVPGDKELLVELTAFGVQDPEDINLWLELPDVGAPAFVQTQAEWLGKDNSGAVRLVYRLQAVEGYQAEDGVLYNLIIESASAEPLLTQAYQVRTDSDPRIAQVEVLDSAIAKLRVTLEGVSAGEYSVELFAADESYSWHSLGDQAVSYDGSGSLALQFTDQGQPLSLNGYYQLLFAGRLSKQFFFYGSIHSLPQRYEQAVLTDIVPANLAAGEKVQVSGHIANLGQGAVQLELVQVDEAGRMDRVPGWQPVPLTPTVAYDPLAYRFVNYFLVQGSFTVPSDLQPGQDYRWLVSCSNLQGNARELLATVDMSLGSPDPASGNLWVVGAPHMFQHGEGPGSGMPQNTFFIGGDTTELTVELQNLQGVTDFRLLAFTLQDAANNTVGSLRSGSLVGGADAASCLLDTSGPLAVGCYSLSATYGGSELASATVEVIAESLVSDDMAYPGDEQRFFASSSCFGLSMDAALNIDEDALSAILEPAGGGTPITADVSLARDEGLSAYFACQTEETLQGVYLLRLLYDGQPLQALDYGNRSQIEVPPRAICFAPYARVAFAFEEDGVYGFSGDGFDVSADYTVALYRSGQPFDRTSLIPLTRQNDTELILAASNLPSGWKGQSQALVFADGQLLPLTRELLVILQPSELPVIDPTVTVNGGAAFSFEPEVTVEVSPGTYSEMRYAFSQAELAGLDYQPIGASLTWQLGDQYGTKQLYLQFRDASGREKLLTLSIDYISRELPEPSGYGLSASEVCSGQPLTIWAKSGLPVQVQAKFLTGEGTLIGQSLAVARTSLEYGVSTYSRTISIDGTQHAAVQQVELQLSETSTGRTWSTRLPLAFEPSLFISQTQTAIDRVYFFSAYAKQQSPIKCNAVGSPNMTESAAVLIYDTESASELRQSIDLAETAPGSGIYQGEGLVPTGAVYLSRIEYQLTSDLQQQVHTEQLNLPVTASVQFAGLPVSGDYDGMVLYLNHSSGWIGCELEVSDHTPLQFLGVTPGNYRYYLSDGRRTYASRNLQLRAGQSPTVSLAEALVPAKLTISVDQPEVRGRVICRVSSQSSSWTEQFDLGQTLGGLAVGDTLTYQVQIDYPAGLSYYKPMQVGPITVGETNVTIVEPLTPISRVAITGRVIDELFAQAAAPKTVGIAGTTVYLEQVLNNSGTYVYNNQSATSGSDGSFALLVFRDVGGVLRVSKPGYQELQCELTAEQLQSNQLDDLLLRYLTTGYLSFQLEVAPASLEAGEAGYQPDFLPAAAGLAHISAVSRSDGSPVYGYFDFTSNKFYASGRHGLAAGDTLTVQVAAGQGLQLVRDEFTVELDAHMSAQITARAVASGQIQGTATNANGYPVHTLVFAAAGGARAHYSTGSAFSTRDAELPPGDYTVVHLSGDALQRASRITRLQQLQEFGLIDGTHYASRQVSLLQGLIVDLAQVDVPTVTDDGLGYLSTQGTGVAVKAGSLTTPGKVRGVLTFRYSLPEPLQQRGYAVTAIEATMPWDAGKIVNQECYLNGQKLTTGPDHVFSYIDGANAGSGALQFEVELTQQSQTKVTVMANIAGEGRYAREVVFEGTIDLPLLTLTAPEEVLPSNSGEIIVSGIGYAGETVEIRDDGNLVGQAVANERGRWEAKINLVEPLQPRQHQLTATMNVNGVTLSASYQTRIVFASAVRVESAKVWQPYYFEMDVGFSDGQANKPMIISPSAPVYAHFKLANADPDDVAYAGLVNDYRGQETLFPATYMETGDQAGYWFVDGFRLPKPGTLSIVYSLKVQADPLQEARAVAGLTGSRVIDVRDLPDNPPLDVNTLPGFMQESIRNSTDLSDLVVQNDPENAPYLRGDESGAGDVAATLDLGSGRQLALQGSSQAYAGTVPAGYIRIDTEQGPYWTKSPDVSIGVDSITVDYAAYFSSQLWQALSASPQRAGRMGAMGLQDGLQKLEFTSTATGVAGDLYELSKGANTLGRVGSGLNVLGGVSLAANALLGQMGLDPAELRAAANLIVEDELLGERDLIIGFINEYQAATQKSHYINTFIGGVGYVASFVGPVGKGLSYVATAGGSAYSSAIGSEYESWGNSIVSMIRSALEKQERLLAKKKKLNEPNWKVDPSGYVFEATEAERIANVTATVLLRDGDGFRVWSEAEDWDEINPQMTDSEGKYGWDVPEGEWKVRFQSADYQTYETKPMQVPPLHDQVNIGLLAKAAPEVTEMKLYPDALLVAFDRYMLPESLVGSVLLSDHAGKPIAVRAVVPIDAVANTGYTGEGQYSDLDIDAAQFAKQFKILPATATGGFAQYLDDGETAATYTVRLLTGIASYAQVPMAAAYDSGPLTVSEREAIPITVRAQAKNKVYGDADPEFGYEVVSGDFAAGDELSGELERQPGDHVGSYQITQGTLSGGAKYSITFEPGLFTISRRPITVSAQSKQKYVGSSDPQLTWQLTGGSLVGNDSLAGALTRQPGESIGVYTINQGTLAASGNYLLTFVPASLAIVARPVNPPGDGGGSVTPSDPGAPVIPETPGEIVQVPLTASAETDAAGNVIGYSFTTPDTLVEQIATAQTGGAVRFDLQLSAGEDVNNSTPRSLTIASDALQAAAAGTDFTLTVSTVVGTISLPPALLDVLAAAGQPLAMTIHQLPAADSLPAGATALGQPLAVETKLTGRTGVEIPLQLPLPKDPAARAAMLHSFSIFAVHSSGGRDLIYDLQFDIDETVSPAALKSVRFQVDQFSSFTLVKFANEPLTTKVGVPGYRIGSQSRELPACFYQQSDTYMPLRMLEQYGVVLGWEAANRTVTVSYRGRSVTLVVGSTVAAVDGAEQAIVGASGRLLAPVITGDRVMLPLRFVSEVLGFQVHWEPSHVITIKP